MIQDVKTLLQLVKPFKTHAFREHIEELYKNRPVDYGRFRKKLLAGRKNFYQKIVQETKSGIWVDFGAGTGSLLDFLEDDQIKGFEKIYLVDVSLSSLTVAQEKISSRNLKNVETVTREMINFRPPDFADLVTLSYSLTMTPQWYLVLDHVYQILTPGGKAGILDFYISEKHPLEGLRTHDPATRHFWPLWFSYDNVFLSPDHLPYLINKFERVFLYEGQKSIPMLPVGKVPYYAFIGMKSY